MSVQMHTHKNLNLDYIQIIMTKKNMKTVKPEVETIGLIAIALLLTVPITLSFEDAEALRGRNAPNKLSCDDIVPPIVTDIHKHDVTSETTFNADIKIIQKQGECIWMSGNAAHLYSIQYMPLMYKAELFDINFPEETLDTQVFTNIMDEEFTITLEGLSVGIEYGVKVTSFFMNEDNITETVTSEATCYEVDPLWMGQ